MIQTITCPDCGAIYPEETVECLPYTGDDDEFRWYDCPCGGDLKIKRDTEIPCREPGDYAWKSMDRHHR